MSVDSGLPSDTFNIVVLHHDQAQPSDAATIQEAVAYFTQKHHPMALWLWADDQGDSAKMLLDIGLEKAETNIAMYGELAALQPSANKPAEFTIQEVSSPSELELFGDVLASLFGESEEAVHVRSYYKQVSASILQPSVMRWYIGVFQDEVVSTGAMVLTKESIGIYDIATREEHRGRGFGSAMFNFLIREAQQQHRGLCVLQASPDGINIYAKAGFQPVGEVTVYENRHFI
ncbi:GNAT family N-acetyltransferase [Paenibacillus sp. JCM 10914]|uniref:GNAT family N-acetyltransferase n=1 Tax=Paenibacillus sp. JCM 10914 TaxID=1236974 RepID=UPI0003CC81E0|nr:GNAT family N-acetyltransferase [Paenibacillus sp. JCM 10914]GAE07861.1 histone acetyltransferase HPA2 and related acetyltransferases [Paenibacillus sp. JCM 10914]